MNIRTAGSSSLVCKHTVVVQTCKTEYPRAFKELEGVETSTALSGCRQRESQPLAPFYDG